MGVPHMNDSTYVLESQIDWLTAAVHSGRKAQEWYWHALRWRKSEEKLGNRLQPFVLGSYTGERCGRVGFGSRENAGIFQLSGDLADEHFHTLWREHDTVTRVDVAVTVCTPEYEQSIARNAFVASQELRSSHPRLAMPSLVQNGDGGDTCYIGHRSSDQYCRIYNKQAECISQHDPDGADHYARCWRYELEVKGGAAHQLAETLASTPDRGAYIRSFLWAYLRNHGVIPWFDPSSTVALAPGFRRRSDRDSRLEWLSTSVAPAVTWLLGNTDREEILRILHLDA